MERKEIERREGGREGRKRRKEDKGVQE